MLAARLAAATACVALLAGSAHAFTVVTTGVAADFSVEVPGLEQGNTYFVQYVSDIPWEANQFYLNYRTTRYVDIDGTPTFGIQFNNQTYLNPTATSYGFEGAFTTLADSYGDGTHSYYDKMVFYGIALSPSHPQAPSDTPWTLTISTDPIAAPGSVPEPATWAMMIVGFGLIGAATRRCLWPRAKRFSPARTRSRARHIARGN